MYKIIDNLKVHKIKIYDVNSYIIVKPLDSFNVNLKQ